MTINNTPTSAVKADSKNKNVVGKVGDSDVVDYNGTKCLVLDKAWFSVGKAKAALANADKLRLFIAEYDKPKAAPAAKVKAPAATPEQVGTFAQKMAIVQAQIDALSKRLAATALPPAEVQPQATLQA